MGKEAFGIAKKGALAKSRQNSVARQYLLDTGDKIIGDASKDSFWGIGMKLDDSAVLQKAQWTGANTMGRVHQSVREILRVEFANA